MAEKPILFNTAMVRAILDGRKTQTRRLVKPIKSHYVMDGKPTNNPPCNPGDILWVRETWQRSFDFGGWQYEYRADYEDDDPLRLYGMYVTWRPSIHMPREAARLFLRVTGVRCERLQDMTPEDCANDGGFEPEAVKVVGIAPLFGTLWDSTLRKDAIKRWGWDANPWVFVISFERIFDYEKM